MRCVNLALVYVLRVFEQSVRWYVENMITETERLLVEPLQLAHADKLFAGLSNPDLYEYIPQNPPNDITDVAERFRRIIAGSGNPGERWLNWALRLKNIDRYVGTLEATIHKDTETASIAYFIFREHWRKGFGREGCSWLCEYLRKTVECKKIIAEVDALNIQSIELLQSVGFKSIKLTKNADHFKGRDSDEWLFEFDCFEKR
jgi:[ribosomal protein S5]-alanine N-acetyltransferase